MRPVFLCAVLAACSMGISAMTALAKSSLGREDVETFCAEAGRAQPPSKVCSSTARAADERVMTLAAGRYDMPENVAVLLFDSGAFLLRVKDNSGQAYGTGGDDMLAPGGLVGGCSREQLSEVTARNGLDAGLLAR